METNIDDCPSELLEYKQELLFQNGALDVFFTPIHMKKNRPAYRMTIAYKKEDMTKLQKIIFLVVEISLKFKKSTRQTQMNIIY